MRLAAWAVVILASGLVPFAALGAGEAVRHVPCSRSGPECGRALQDAIDAAPPGWTLTLDAGRVYEGTVNLRPKEGAGPDARLTITTRGWDDRGDGWQGLVRPSDKPRMAVLRASPGEPSAFDIRSGPGSGHVELVGLAFEANPPAGQGDVIRIGSGRDTAADYLPRAITIRQVLIQGDRRYGQKRAIAANGQDLLIEQVWCEEIFTAGQDNQCIAAWNGGHRVRVRHSYLAAGSENILLGGATVAAAGMHPQDWAIEDVILHKPLRWKEDGRNRAVKNLLEFKHGENLTVRRVLAVNSWRAAQTGQGVLINYTTNGRCPECGNLENVLIEDLVMLNTEAGLSIQGYSWQPDSHSDGRVRNVTLRNVYMQLSGPGRLIQITNVLGRHDIRIERSTFVNSGTQWILGEYGFAWVSDDERVPGGPFKGLWVVDNVFAANGRYGITAPDGHHFGSGIGMFVDDDLQISGNVIGDAPSNHLDNYNRHTAGGPKNVSADGERLRVMLGGTSCGTWASGKGADCARLAPIFAWRAMLPEP